MAKSIKGTQTEKNLLTSFAGESQASKSLLSFWKQLSRKKNTLSVCSNI